MFGYNCPKNKKISRVSTIKKHMLRGVIPLLIGILVVGSTFGFSPRTTYALDGGGSLGLLAKEIADAIGWIFADQMIGAISNQTFQWSSEGFGNLTLSVDPTNLKPVKQFLSGDASFLENPAEFFSAIGDEITVYFLGELKTIADDGVEGIREGLITSLARESQKGNESFTSRLTTTIDSKVLAKFTDETGSFYDAGGWSTWLQMTNNPQNYFDGAMHIALSELDMMKNSAVERNKEELMQSGGFLSIRQCQTLSDLGITDPQLRKYAKVDEQGCAGYKNVTPGGLIGEKVKSAITSDISRIEGADEITEIIAALITTAIDQLVQAGFSEITKVTQNFGTPRDIEQKGLQEVSKVQQRLYGSGNDGTGEAAPPPANPEEAVSWSTGPALNSSNVTHDDYWTQISWSAPVGMAEDDIAGYIIYRFEDRPQPRLQTIDGKPQPVIDSDGKQIIDPPNGIRDENEPEITVATKSKENGTLTQDTQDNYELIYVDSSRNPSKRYGYYIVAFDSSYNRTRSSSVVIVGPTETKDGEDGDTKAAEVDVLPTLRSLRVGDEETGSDQSVYTLEVGAYWLPADQDLPRFDTVVTIKQSNGQIVSQEIIRYGRGSTNKNGIPVTISFSVPKENKSEGMAPYVDVEVKADASNKIRESSESNNTKTLRVHLKPEDNLSLIQ